MSVAKSLSGTCLVTAGAQAGLITLGPQRTMFSTVYLSLHLDCCVHFRVLCAAHAKLIK